MRKLLVVAFMGSVVLIGQTNTALSIATGNIQGTVTDPSTNKPIAGPIVWAVSIGWPSVIQSASSAADGSYQIQNQL
jgi:hypothetical protein